MQFIETNIAGVWLLQPDLLEDERGFFARTWCSQQFDEKGLNSSLSQCSVSFNKTAGTLRGMHYQLSPNEEDKLVRCTMGAIYDVALDLRPTSSSYKQWVAFELSASNRNMLYIPGGVAHGFQTLEDSSEVFYQISQPFVPESASGVRWDDQAFSIKWPDVSSPRVMSDKDRHYPDYTG